MKKITVINNVTGLSYGASLEDAQAATWKQECIDNNSWGLPERWVLEGDPEIPEGAETKVDVDEFGAEQTYYKIPCQYTITETVLDTDPAYLLEQAMAKSSANIDFGKFILANVGALVEIKALTCEQVSTLNSGLASIIMLLQTGSIETAKNAISNITPDATITADDISYIVGLMNTYLGA